MSFEHSEPTDGSLVVDDVAEKPASMYSEEPVSRVRLFNRQRSLHEILGSGKAADTFLWRDKLMSAGILGIATIAYFLLQHSGYTLMTILGNVLVFSITVLFLWSNAANFLNRSPPPLPILHISEEAARSLALALQSEINRALAVAHDIALGKDFKCFLKVAAVLWGLSVVGGWFHLLTLLYLAVVVSHTVPIVYENYEDQIESYAKRAFNEAHHQYRRVDENIISKIYNAAPKLKKSE